MSATLASPPSETASETLQFITFHVRNELFGLPLGEVQEIIRMPGLVEVPLSPHTLEGIANLRGAVLPITSLRRVFGTEDVACDDGTRVVVVNRCGRLAGFVVDRMSSVITAEAGEIEGIDAIETTVCCELVRGVVKRAGGMILLLDPARLNAGGAGGHRPRQGIGATVGSVERPSEDKAAVDEVQLVSFEAAGQEYAFPIADVQEIVQVPKLVTRMPHAPSHVVGVITLRDRLLPLVSLRQLFAMPQAPSDERSRILVVSPAGCAAASVGLIVDTVREVLRVNRGLTDPVPTLLAAGNAGEPSEFEAICRLEAGRRLVTILSAERMFRGDALRAAMTAVTQEEQEMSQSTMTAAPGTEEVFVAFRLAGEEYGVPIGAVQEIVRVPADLTRLPKAAAFMEGVVNLRGMVLPVVDQRRRFGLERVERNDRQRIMVLMIGGIRSGFIVDAVTEVMRIPAAAIGPAPAMSDEQARLIRRVANLEAQKRIVLLLDPADLLDIGEVDTLAMSARSDG